MGSYYKALNLDKREVMTSGPFNCKASGWEAGAAGSALAFLMMHGWNDNRVKIVCDEASDYEKAPNYSSHAGFRDVTRDAFAGWSRVAWKWIDAETKKLLADELNIDWSGLLDGGSR